MGAQPKPRSGVASLACQDPPSRAAVMLTCAVRSLLCASCLFSRFLSAQHVSKQSNLVSRIQYCLSADFCLCQSRNCPHNCSTVLCVPSYATLLSFSIVDSSGSTLTSSSLMPADIPGHSPKPSGIRSRGLVGAIFMQVKFVRGELS